jgi:hypothetical protein
VPEPDYTRLRARQTGSGALDAESSRWTGDPSSSRRDETGRALGVRVGNGRRSLSLDETRAAGRLHQRARLGGQVASEGLSSRA